MGVVVVGVGPCLNLQPAVGLIRVVPIIGGFPLEFLDLADLLERQVQGELPDSLDQIANVLGIGEGRGQVVVDGQAHLRFPFLVSADIHHTRVSQQTHAATPSCVSFVTRPFWAREITAPATVPNGILRAEAISATDTRAEGRAASNRWAS